MMANVHARVCGPERGDEPIRPVVSQSKAITAPGYSVGPPRAVVWP